MKPVDDPAPITYRGVAIRIQLDQDGDTVFGRADLFAGDEFKARLALGSQGRPAKDVIDRLKCLAKSKVDVWAIACSGTVN